MAAVNFSREALERIRGNSQENLKFRNKKVGTISPKDADLFLRGVEKVSEAVGDHMFHVAYATPESYRNVLSILRDRLGE